MRPRLRFLGASLVLVAAACTPVDMSGRSAQTVIRLDHTLRVAADRLAALDRSRRTSTSAGRRAPRSRPRAIAPS